MLCNSLSFYPAKIDPLIFFQDVSLDHIHIIDTYHTLISQGKYSEANEYINSQKGIFGCFADFLNAIENRIYNLQQHLLTIEPKQPFVLSDEEPEISAAGKLRLLSNDTNTDLKEYIHKELTALSGNQSISDNQSNSVNRSVSDNEIIWI